MLRPPLLPLSHLLLRLSLSSCSVGERDHPRPVRLCGEVGNIQKESGLRPQGCGRRCSHHGVGAEGAGSPSHGSVPSGSAPDTDGAGLPPAHLPHLCLRSQQPAAEERHVLLESWHADTVELNTDKCINIQHFLQAMPSPPWEVMWCVTKKSSENSTGISECVTFLINEGIKLLNHIQNKLKCCLLYIQMNTIQRWEI